MAYFNVAMMKPVIEIKSMGEKSKPYVEDMRRLREKIESEGVRFEDVRAYDIVDEIFISVIGGVAVYLIEAIVEAIVSRKNKSTTDNVKIVIIDKSTNITFNLPQDQSKVIKHFKNKQRRKK